MSERRGKNHGCSDFVTELSCHHQHPRERLPRTCLIAVWVSFFSFCSCAGCEASCRRGHGESKMTGMAGEGIRCTRCVSLRYGLTGCGRAGWGGTIHGACRRTAFWEEVGRRGVSPLPFIRGPCSGGQLAAIILKWKLLERQTKD